MAVPRRRLTVVDRTTIELRLLDGWGIRAIARALDRSAGTISEEIKRHHDASGYLAHADRRLSGRKPRLASDGALFGEVAGLLRLGWSPEQISGRRKRIEAGMEHQSCRATIRMRQCVYQAGGRCC
jgi:IS30 family transposase